LERGTSLRCRTDRPSPGQKNYPLHAHAAQTEHDIILEGTGTLHTGQGSSRLIRAGDHFICHPGLAHQIENTSGNDLVYFVIADHHRADVTTYPSTGKRHLKPEYRSVRVDDADYYEGEE
jgi:uncharacterized cupin superfamily protein